MILALVQPQDVSIWRRAVRRLPAPWMVRVEEVGFDLAQLDGPVQGLIVRGKDPRGSAFEFAPLSALVVLHMAGSHGSIHPIPASVKNSFTSLGGYVFQAARYGNYILNNESVLVGLRSSDLMTVEWPRPTTGPGSRGSGAPVLWDEDVFSGLGVRVSRDEPEVLQAVLNAVRGDGPLWVRPGYPFIVPPSPLSFRSLNGSRVQGLLCTDISNPGGWVVLRQEDILILVEHSGDYAWSELSSLVGVTPVSILLGWVCSVIARLSVMPAEAG